MSAGIVYYSKSNNTRTGAQYLASKTNAELIELSEKQDRKGLVGFMKSGFQAVAQKSSALIDDPWKRIEGLTKIYLMTPIWASNGTPAMNRFLKEADFSGKEVAIITFQADPEKASSSKVHDYYKALIEKKGGRFLKGIGLHSAGPGKFAGKEYIESQVEKSMKEIQPGMF